MSNAYDALRNAIDWTAHAKALREAGHSEHEVLRVIRDGIGPCPRQLALTAHAIGTNLFTTAFHLRNSIGSLDALMDVPGVTLRDAVAALLEANPHPVFQSSVRTALENRGFTRADALALIAELTAKPKETP